MANQITLAFSVATTNTIYSPAQAAAKLAAVPLYASAGTDPVLGQAFGLTVASDAVSIGGVTYTGEAGGPFLPGETVTDTPGGGTATVALDDHGTLYFVEGTESGTFAHGDTITGGTSDATATVNNAAALGGPTTATPGATRVLVLNMTAAGSEPFAPPPFPCRPTGPLTPPPGAPPTLPYTLMQTTVNPYTRQPVTTPAPAAVVAFYSTSNLDTDGFATTPAIPAGCGAQVMALSYLDTAGDAFTVYTKLTGKYPAVVTLGSAKPLAEITACFVFQTGAFENSVGQITLCALAAALPAIPAEATPADFPGLTDAAQLTIVRPLVYLPPSYFALAQQQNSDPQLAGDFLVAPDSPTVLTKVDQSGVLTAGNVIEFASQPGVEYTIASISTGGALKLTTPYTGLSAADTAPAAETPHPAQSVSENADRIVTSATLVTPSQAAPPDSAHLMTLLAEFTLPQATAPALTYVDVAGGPFTPSETATGQKSTGSGTVLYDNPGVDESGTLAFTPGSVKIGFVEGETVVGGTSHATATVVVPRTLASNPQPVRLSGLYARALSLALGAPVVSQPITLI